ncbi:MAG: thiosulfate dehydrogenase (quinone) large subunit [Nocardioidaceae bacterium]|jgi:thiosulfate dehydrogenase [quinone] large subunit|nr:thiosulfate dehydrogenase (quinone) large subunit [Nocardioidaceae bacterium]
MTTLHLPPDAGMAGTTTHRKESDLVTSGPARKALAVMRVAFGLTFLWAFFDKLIGLGFSTGAVTNSAGAKTGIDFFSKDAWINGGNPTLGFLKFGATGPFKGFFNGIAGEVWVNWAFMLGLLLIGLTLTLGIAIRIGAAAGFVMYLMMWSVALLPTTNPVIDDHILGAAAMAVLGLTLAGDTWGFGKAWSRLHLVAANAVLR